MHCGQIDLLHLRAVSDQQHQRLMRTLGMRGGFFTSAKSGDSLLKSLYKAVGDACGMPLSEAELEAYNKVTEGGMPALNELAPFLAK